MAVLHTRMLKKKHFIFEYERPSYVKSFIVVVDNHELGYAYVWTIFPSSYTLSTFLEIILS